MDPIATLQGDKAHKCHPGHVPGSVIKKPQSKTDAGTESGMTVRKSRG